MKDMKAVCLPDLCVLVKLLQTYDTLGLVVLLVLEILVLLAAQFAVDHLLENLRVHFYFHGLHTRLLTVAGAVVVEETDRGVERVDHAEG